MHIHVHDVVCLYSNERIKKEKSILFTVININLLLFLSVGMLLIGAIIHGTNDPDNINWTFWFCLISALLCLILGIMWKITQKMKRFMKKEASGALEGMGAGAIAGMI